jgi:hypothetical protein
MGVGSVALVYDLVRRRFGPFAGFAGGLALAITPITVAVAMKTWVFRRQRRSPRHADRPALDRAC